MTIATADPSGGEGVEVRSATNGQSDKALPACRSIPPWASLWASARPLASCSLPNILANADADHTIVNIDVIQRYVCMYAMKSCA